MNLLNPLFRQDNLNRLDSDYISSTPCVVVGGSGRSGTTLLRVMLDSHRNICCGPESRLFLPETIDKPVLASKFDFTPAQMEQMGRGVKSRAEFVDRFFKEYSQAMHKPRWAEKTPRNIECLDYIFKYFPQARFIHIIRDGRDVACSLRTHPRYAVKDGKLTPLNTWKPIGDCIERWRRVIRVSRQYQTDPRYLEVHYEELVLTPQPVLEKVFSFIGEPWDDNALHYYEQHSASRDLAKIPQNPEAREPLKSEAIGRWRHDLTPDDKAIFKQMAGNLLIELGYETSEDW